MELSATCGHRRSGCRSAAVAVMLSLWVGLFALAAVPELHHLLHPDAQKATHNCLVTQIQHQQVLGECVPVVVPAAPTAVLGSASAGDCQFVPTTDYRLSPSRAPPSIASSLRITG